LTENLGVNKMEALKNEKQSAVFTACYSLLHRFPFCWAGGGGGREGGTGIIPYLHRLEVEIREVSLYEHPYLL
jgi:hypothetical protein